MGQNNDPAEHGDPQGQQNGQAPIPAGERKRQSGYAPAQDPQPEPSGGSSERSAPSNERS
jgi:hypothetical protein